VNRIDKQSVLLLAAIVGALACVLLAIWLFNA
jgi:hypothetical protein